MLCEPQDRGKLKREPGRMGGRSYLPTLHPGSTLLRFPNPDGLLHPSLLIPLHLPTPSPFCPSYTHIERGPYLASSKVTPKPWRATSPVAVFLLSPPSPPPTSTQLLTYSQLLPPSKTLPASQSPAWREPPPTGPFGTRTNSPSQSYISRNPSWPIAPQNSTGNPWSRTVPNANLKTYSVLL